MSDEIDNDLLILKNPFVFGILTTSSLFTIFTIFTSFHLILNHFKFYSKPNHQRCIIRIIFMIPLYSVLTLLTLIFYKQKIYLELFRDLYEAYGIYTFFALMVCYAGGDNNLINHFISHEPIYLFSSKIPFLSKLQYKPNQNFLNYCRISVFQYVLVKPMVTMLSIIFIQFDLYGSSFMQFNSFYPYKVMIQFVSVGLSLSTIILFLRVSQSLLLPYKPILKFLSIKIVLGVCFWQSIIFMFINKLNILPNFENLTSFQFLELINIGLITFELSIVSIVHLYAYPYDLYRVIAVKSQPLLLEERVHIGSIFNNIFHTINQHDMVEETVKSIKGSSASNFKTLASSDYLDFEENDFEKVEMGEFQSYKHFKRFSEISTTSSPSPSAIVTSTTGSNNEEIEIISDVVIMDEIKNEISTNNNDDDDGVSSTIDSDSSKITINKIEMNEINNNNNNFINDGADYQKINSNDCNNGESGNDCNITVIENNNNNNNNNNINQSSCIKSKNNAILNQQEYISDDLFFSLITSEDDSNSIDENCIVDDHEDVSRNIKR